MPTMPHSEAGLRIEPPVSVPIAAGKKPAASPAPLPLDEPPGKCSRFHGLRAGGQGRSNDGPPTANSWVDNLPSSTPPRSEEHTSELQSRFDLVCRLLLEKKNTILFPLLFIQKKRKQQRK